VYVDSGCAKDLGRIWLMISARYGWPAELFLAKKFDEAARLFVPRPFPRIIRLAVDEWFCARRGGDDLLYAEWSHVDGGVVVKKMEWQLDGEPLKTIDEALSRLNEYGENTTGGLSLKERIKYATAYEVHPF
jgi:hypothetical protein